MVEMSPLPRVPSRGAWTDVFLPSSLEFLDRTEVHIWATRSHWHAKSSLDRYFAILNEPERRRASNFAFDKDRNEYVTAHAMLRITLARYLRCEPKYVVLTQSHHGKPVCLQDTECTFNLTHSQGAILIAVAAGYDVGVDVERVRPVPDIENLARRYFASKENERLFAFDPIERERAFFQLWTRKEAYLKSLGAGLWHSLDSFEVAFGSGVPFRLCGEEPGPWSLFDFEPFRGFVGALAVRGASLQLCGGVLRSVISPMSR